jgi:hypothetical protein
MAAEACVEIIVVTATFAVLAVREHLYNKVIKWQTTSKQP